MQNIHTHIYIYTYDCFLTEYTFSQQLIGFKVNEMINVYWKKSQNPYCHVTYNLDLLYGSANAILKKKKKERPLFILIQIIVQK